MLKQSKKFEEAIKTLNTEQKQAVETIEGPVMVLAGPGTGKTQVVAMRIANILQKTQLGPQNILALTFTEAGVAALRERLSQLIGPIAYRVTVATFHSFANEVIGIFPHLFTQSQTLRQVTDPDRFLLIEEIITTEKSLSELRPLRKPDLYVQEISARIKTCKQEAVTPERLRELFASSVDPKAPAQAKKRQQEFVIVLRRYNEELTKRGWYDYEDTIAFVVDALRANDEVRSYFQERYQYMLVDEYQDTNNSQNALVEALADFYPDPNLFVVGDDKQAIYRFQGASVANMLHFKRRYPRMLVIALTDNYRSTEPILKVASQLISYNRSQIEAKLGKKTQILVAQKKTGAIAQVLQCDSQVSQFDEILSQVKRAAQSGTPLANIAVLFRKRQAVKDFSDTAKRYGVTVSGQIEVDLFSHPVTKSILRFLTAVERPVNNLAVISAIRAKLSDKALLALYKINRSSRSQTILIEKLISEGGELGKVTKDLLELHRRSELLTIEELLHETLEKYQFLQRQVFVNNTVEATELLLALINLARNFSTQTARTGLGDFLQYCQMIRSRSLEVPITKLLPAAGLFVGTVHSAKGLEFDQVFMADTDERSWSLKHRPELIKLPGEIVGLSDWSDDPVEDERRLFYVGITRAKTTLTFTYAVADKENRPQLPCPFLLELGKLPIKPVSLAPKKAKKLAQTLLGNSQTNIVNAASITTYIHEQIASSGFSYSDLRAFQTCPQQYLFSRVLRFPQPTSESLMYGSAVHKALELVFREFKALKKLPTKQSFIKMIELAVAQTVLPASQEKILEHARTVLSKYWDKKVASWTMPVGIEYSFTHHHARYGDIWLTGKFDRIDLLDGKTNAVRVVDYKTKSRPITRNEIIGATQNSDGAIKEQLVFYAMLAKHDPLFPYRIKDFSVSVIDDKGEFRDEIITVTTDEILAMEKKIVDIHGEILSREAFLHVRSTFDKGCEICEMYGLT